MAGITLAVAEARLSAWIDAEEALETSQSYSHNGRALTRADLGSIGERITYWDQMVRRLSRGGPTVSRLTLHD